jgi:nucleotide-binding universal stress UspA family protein
MSTAQPGPVVVGTDGSVHADIAVDVAAWEANRRGVGLRIVHGYSAPLPYMGVGTAPYPVEPTHPDVAMTAMVNAAVERVRDRYPRLHAVGVVAEASPTALLVDESRQASLVVVGSRGVGGFSGLLTGSVSMQLGAHAMCPLIVARQTTGSDHPTDATIVAGVDGSAQSEAAIGFAFDEAEARGLPLVLLYAWWTLPASNLGPITLHHYDLEEASVEAERLLAEAVAGWSSKYTDVKVERRASHEMNPAAALIDAGAHADLIVVSRRGGGALSRLLLGSVGDAVVRHAPCSVAVVPGA